MSHGTRQSRQSLFFPRATCDENNLGYYPSIWSICPDSLPGARTPVARLAITCATGVARSGKTSAAAGLVDPRSGRCGPWPGRRAPWDRAGNIAGRCARSRTGRPGGRASGPPSPAAAAPRPRRGPRRPPRAGNRNARNAGPSTHRWSSSCCAPASPSRHRRASRYGAAYDVAGRRVGAACERSASAGLQTGPISSFMKGCASMPSGHGGAPMRIATSTPSRAKSTAADEADRRTSIAGCRALKS